MSGVDNSVQDEDTSESSPPSLYLAPTTSTKPIHIFTSYQEFIDAFTQHEIQSVSISTTSKTSRLALNLIRTS